MQTVDRAAEETVEVADGVHLTPLAATDRMSVSHFHVEPGARVPEHSHRHEQVGFVCDGALTLIAGGEYTVTTGESYALADGEVHAAENRGDVAAAGVDVFSPPREGFPE
jgi:quercetin dioxygenase-like cupin family protein